MFPSFVICPIIMTGVDVFFAKLISSEVQVLICDTLPGAESTNSVFNV